LLRDAEPVFLAVDLSEVDRILLQRERHGTTCGHLDRALADRNDVLEFEPQIIVFDRVGTHISQRTQGRYRAAAERTRSRSEIDRLSFCFYSYADPRLPLPVGGAYGNAEQQQRDEKDRSRHHEVLGSVTSVRRRRYP